MKTLITLLALAAFATAAPKDVFTVSGTVTAKKGTTLTVEAVRIALCEPPTFAGTVVLKSHPDAERIAVGASVRCIVRRMESGAFSFWK